MEKQQYIDRAEEVLYKTYNRFGLVLDKGDGVYLYDTDGKKYLDFAAGIAVFAFGYNNKEFNDSIKAQIDKLIHTSNLFYNVPAIEAAEKLIKVSGMDKVFFTNSGTEAIEGAIKIARRYAYNKDGSSDHEIIAMEHSFHGRSLGALSVTGNAKYQEPFKPLIGGIKFAKYNDLESVKALVNEKTCAIILETLQGEGGIYPATDEFIKGIREICDEKDILMICDEIQCGMGRTGKMFAYEHYDILPDVVTVAKAVGCGIPVGTFMAKGKAATALVPGDHGTTYGGNPLATKAISTVLDMYESHNMVEHVCEVAPYFEEVLEKIVEDYDFIKVRRGKGFMQGLVCEKPVGTIVSKCIEEGLIVISAGADVLRFVPPLIITKENIDEMAVILRRVLNSI